MKNGNFISKHGEIESSRLLVRSYNMTLKEPHLPVTSLKLLFWFTNRQRVYSGAIQSLMIYNKIVGIGIKASRTDCVGAQGPNNPCSRITKFSVVIRGKRWADSQGPI